MRGMAKNYVLPHGYAEHDPANQNPRRCWKKARLLAVTAAAAGHSTSEEMSGLDDIKQRLVRIETLLEAALPLEARVRKVENRQSWMAGMGAAVGTAFTLAIGYVRAHT